MKAIALVMAACGLMVLVSLAQLRLFGITEPAPPKPKPAVVKSDKEALADWWRDEHGDEPYKIFDIKPSKPLSSFEVDIGDDWRPHWINLAGWLKEEGKGASAFAAKISAPDDKKPPSRVYVVSDGAIIYSQSGFRTAR